MINNIITIVMITAGTYITQTEKHLEKAYTSKLSTQTGMSNT